MLRPPWRSAFVRPLILALLGAGILFARFPNGVLHAELWAEDGWTFYPQAYESGARCLLWPVGGYLNSVQRLGALSAVWSGLPLADVPTLFALTGLATQLASALFLAGPRLRPLWPSDTARALFAGLYLCLPNSVETFGNLTDSQWHLCLLAFMIVMAPPLPAARATAWGWRLFDGAVLVASGLSGPFCLVLAPFCAERLRGAWHDRAARRQALWRGALVGGCAVVQLACLLGTRHARQLAPLGADALPLAHVVALQVVLGLLLGLHSIIGIARAPWWQPDGPSLAVTVAAAGLAAYAVRRGSVLLRAFCLFSLLLFAAELASPAVSASMPQWRMLMVPWAGQRYFLLPMLAWAGVLFTLAGTAAPAARVAGLLGLAAICLWAIPNDWSYPELGRTDFVSRATAFAAAPPGTRAEFPIHPTGSVMVLIKATREPAPARR